MIIRPKTSMIRSVANTSMSWKVALTELIDNSLDAGARTVDVSIVSTGKAKRMLRVADDGCGSAVLEPFFQLGAHEEHSSVGRGSGTYGVGGTEAALWVGGTNSIFAVDTTHKCTKRLSSLNWMSMFKDDEWIMDDPSVRAMPVGTPSGTTITINPIERQIPSGEAWDRLVSELSIIYSPAIRNRGVQIKIRRHSQSAPTVLQPFALPEFEGEMVNAQIEVGGKRLSIRAGIVKDGVDNPLPGLTYGHRYRALSDHISDHLGCGSAPIARICGWVQLDDSWERFKNKQGFKGSKGAGDGVAQAMKPLLERAETSGAELRSTAFASAVQDAVNAGMAAADGARARRSGPKEKVGRQRPTGAGAVHRDAQVKQVGGPMPWRVGTQLRIVWHRLGDSGAGRVDGHVVTLNLDSPLVRTARDTDNVLATKVVVDSLIASSYAIRGERNLRFSFAVQDEDAARQFDQIFGGLLSATHEMNGRPMLTLVDNEAAE